MADVIDLRDLVAARLNLPGWSKLFVAEPVYAPELELKEVGSLRVLVAARSRSQEVHSRAEDQLDWEVDVGIFQRVGTDPATADRLDHAEVKALLALAQEVAAAFHRLEAASPAAAVWKVAAEPLYDPAALAERQEFRSVTTISFRGYA